jgi:hypothetical protein
MANEALQTEVGKWLQANGAGSYAQKFYDEGYTDKADVTKEAIDEIMKSTKPGLAAKLDRLLAGERRAAAPKDPKSPPSIPDLPAGTTLDLALSEISAPDVPAFTLPAELSVQASDATLVMSPDKLAPSDWMLLAKNSKLLYAYTMENFSDKDPFPPQGFHPVLFWKVQANTDFFRSEILGASIGSALTYTQETANYVRAGFDSESASGGYAGCSASFEREHKERVARSSLDKTLQMIGLWYYPRVTLLLDECTAASPNFVDAVKKAVASATPTSDLQAVFDKYGVAVPRRATLGGQLYFVHAQDVHAQVNERSAEETIRAAVSVQVGGGKGSASTSFQTATNEKVTAQTIHDSSTFLVLGGKTLQGSSPSAWPNTINDARLWAVIGTAGMRSVLDLLEPGLRQQALEVWNGMPPGISPLQDLPLERRSAREKTAGFVMASRSAPNGPCGSMRLVCSKSDDPNAQDQDAVVGTATVHKWQNSDIWYNTSSVCLPVPLGYSYHTETWNRFEGNAQTRFAFAPTKLSFGDWSPGIPGGPSGGSDHRVHAASDGFLFVTIHADLGGCGVVRGLIDGKVMAAASVHYWENSDTWIENASFCLPVPKGGTYAVRLEPRFDTNPKVRAWWLPITSLGWRLEPAVTRNLNSDLVAETDGILHGMISMNDEARASLSLFTGPDPTSMTTKQSCATASAHMYAPHDRWVTDGSAMLPVQKDSHYRANFEPTYGSPPVDVFWTGIIPV